MSLQQCAIVRGHLHITWDEISAEFDGNQLRRQCRCAECRALALRGEPIASAESVQILAASPLGYGLQLHFSDGHNRGVFPWSYLRELAQAPRA